MENVYYMTLDQPISLHIGAMKGSNSSISWNFIQSNVKVIAENLDGNSYNVKIIKIRESIDVLIPGSQ